MLYHCVVFEKQKRLEVLDCEGMLLAETSLDVPSDEAVTHKRTLIST
jgi:hypothetical protein